MSAEPPDSSGMGWVWKWRSMSSTDWNHRCCTWHCPWPFRDRRRCCGHRSAWSVLGSWTGKCLCGSMGGPSLPEATWPVSELALPMSPIFRGIYSCGGGGEWGYNRARLGLKGTGICPYAGNTHIIPLTPPISSPKTLKGRDYSPRIRDGETEAWGGVIHPQSQGTELGRKLMFV